MTAGINKQIEVLASLQPGAPQDARADAIADYAAMIGALVLARATDDAGLSEEILQTVRARLKVA